MNGCSVPPGQGEEPSFERRIDRRRWGFLLFLLIVITASFIHTTYYLWIRIAGPALDYYSFRQTQTAISAYWAWREGFRLAYETPVLGFPWSIPFEFPIYQWLMVLARYVGIPFDVGGRLISFAFHIASLLPIWSLTRSLKLDKATFLIIGILFLSCPIYIYWSRTIMIESCALFFAIAWLALLARFMERPNYRILIGTIVVGSLACLAKATTFPAFALLGGFLILSGLLAIWQKAPSPPSFGSLALAFLACVTPLCVGYVWVIYSDLVKTVSPVGSHLTSSRLAEWSLGTLAQRTDVKLWRDVIFNRVLYDTFGGGFLIALVAGGALLTSRRPLIIVLAAVVAFLAAFLLFPNLHSVHAYYQYANAILALAAAGIAIGYIAGTGRTLMASLILIAILVGQIAHFRKAYAPIISVDLAQSNLYLITQLAKQKTAPDEGLIVLGQDWSSAIPYYSERKALAVPGWVRQSVFEQIMANPQMFLGGLRLGAVVYCTDIGYGDRAPAIAAFVANRSVLAEAGSCKLLSPDPGK